MREEDPTLKPRLSHTFCKITDEEVQDEGVEKFQWRGGVLDRVGCQEYMEPTDWLDDVNYDIMQVKAVVGEEKGHKGYEVAMDTPVYQYLESK